MAEFFGDVVLKISFTPSDKLLYFGGKNFYSDTLEFITPPGISYQVRKQEQRGNKLYLEVSSLGCSAPVHATISNFDQRYAILLEQCREAIQQNLSIMVHYKGQEAYPYKARHVDLLYSPKDDKGLIYDLYMDLQTGELEKITFGK